MGTIKDRNSKDLTEAEEIKKRRQGRQGGGTWGSDVAAEGESPNRIPDEHPSSALSPLLPRETPRPEGVPRPSIFILKKKKEEASREELYEKDLNDPDSHNAIVTHKEPDILECEVIWILGSIATNKASGGDGGIPAELFQILRDDAIKMLYSFCQQIWKTQQ